MVLGYYFNGEEVTSRSTRHPRAGAAQGHVRGPQDPVHQWNGYTAATCPSLLENAAVAGHFKPLVDDDGVVRRVPMLIEYEGAYYEPLSLAMVRMLLALETGTLPPVEPSFPSDRRERSYGGAGMGQGRPASDHPGGRARRPR